MKVGKIDNIHLDFEEIRLLLLRPLGQRVDPLFDAEFGRILKTEPIQTLSWGRRSSRRKKSKPWVNFYRGYRGGHRADLWAKEKAQS